MHGYTTYKWHYFKAQSGPLQKPLESQHVQLCLPKGKLGLKQYMFRISELNSDLISSSSLSILLSCESEALSYGFPSSLNCMLCRSIDTWSQTSNDHMYFHYREALSYVSQVGKLFSHYSCKQFVTCVFYEFAFYYFILLDVYCQKNVGLGVQIHIERA